MSHIPRNQPIQFADCLLPPAPPEETVVRKVWGWERWLTNQDLYCGKLLLVIPGFYCSVHRHQV